MAYSSFLLVNSLAYNYTPGPSHLTVQEKLLAQLHRPVFLSHGRSMTRGSRNKFHPHCFAMVQPLELTLLSRALGNFTCLFPPPQKEPLYLLAVLPHSLLPQPLETANLLSGSRSWPVADISRRWDHMMFCE